MSNLPRAFVCSALLVAVSCLGASPPPTAEVEEQTGSGVPEFQRLEEALKHVVEEENLLAYRGVVGGSERFPIVLPSGVETDNWTVNAYFREVFRPFGDAAHRDLATLLTHEHLFVQVGSFAVLNQTMTANGLRFHLDQTPEERMEVQRELIALLEG